MPEIGEIRKTSTYNKQIWIACETCGKERWVVLKKGKPASVICRECAGRSLASRFPLRRIRGEQHYGWKGGRYKHEDGYIEVRVYPDDFFYPMANQRGYVLEHRLVMAKKLGRCLQPWEMVHHKGIRHTGIKNRADNLEDNLELTINGAHSRAHSKGYRDGFSKGYHDGKDKRIRELETEINALKCIKG